MIALLSGFVGTFNLYAVYSVAIPGLAEFGFDGVQSAAGYLTFVSWCIPFAALFIGAEVASAATDVPVSAIAHASGLLAIPLVFVSMFGAFRILGFRFFGSAEPDSLLALLAEQCRRPCPVHTDLAPVSQFNPDVGSDDRPGVSIFVPIRATA